MTKIYNVEVDCPNCAVKMEDAVKGTPGVADAALNFMTLRLKVDFEENADPKKVMKDALKRVRKVDSDCDIIL